MKVLVISSHSNLGGAELHLASFLAHRPEHVEPAVLLVEHGPFAERLESQAIDVHVADGFGARPKPRDLARFERTLAPLLRAERPDVVWASGGKAALLAVAACRARRIPIVWHKVDFSNDAWLAKPLGAAVNGVITVSHAVAVALGPLRRRRLLAVVGIPISLPDTLCVDPVREPPTIGTLARLQPYKGLHHIIGAAELLSDEFPDLRVVLAGDEVPQYPRYRAELERQAASSGITDRVELPGFVGDVTSVLARLTLFVSATYRDSDGYGLEGLGGAVLEASWAGLPVVAARGGGIAEAVADGETGSLTDDPSPASLAAAIAPYLRDAELAAQTGAAGRAFARERCEPRAASRRLFAALERVTR
jgi:glycosyltransferase involved in cell wall biosynthesis